MSVVPLRPVPAPAPQFDLTRVVSELAQVRQDSEDFYVGHTLDTLLHALLAQVQLELRHEARHLTNADSAALEARAFQIVRDFSLSLPRIRELLDSDVLAAYAGATVLGRVTLGRGASVGGNVWLTHDLAPGAHITQAQSRHE